MSKERKAAELVEAATVLLREAEELNEQPLFFNGDGHHIDVIGVLHHTSEALRGIIRDEAGYA